MVFKRLGELLLSLVLVSLSFPALGVPSAENVIITSIPGHSSATVFGKNLYYSKIFRVSVKNLADDELDLSMGCFVGYDKSRKAYYADVIDSTLESGKIAKDVRITGAITFSSDNDQVYNIQYITYEDVCNT